MVTFQLGLLEGNQPARRFYEKMNMVDDGSRIPHMIGGKDVIEVRYVLTGLGAR